MRLIDADKLETHKQLKPFGNSNYEYVEVVYKDDIDDAPTIEPERKIGKWFHYEGMLTCLECNASFYDEIIEYFGDEVPKFCPECGADMRGGDE